MIRQEREIIVAYLGPEGTFSEQASRKYFPKASLVPYPNIIDVFTAVEKENANYGVVPVENSTEGSVRVTLDQLLESKLMICGEVDLKVVHNLIAKPSTKLNEIRVIISHPQALAQCRRFLADKLPNAELREASSTAKAVELLMDLDNAVAIGTEDAAERNGMAVLKRQIEDDPNNITRFFIIGVEDAKPTGSDKTSLVFSTKHIPGSLYKVLEVFAAMDINLTKIESRPEKGKPWSYIFYIDFEGHRIDAKVKDVLEAIKKRCTYIKVLGSYPKASQ